MRTFYKPHRITLDVEGDYSASGGLGGQNRVYSSVIPRVGYTLTDRWVVGGFGQFGQFFSDENSGQVRYSGGGIFTRYYLLKHRFSIYPQVSLGINSLSGPAGSETVPVGSAGIGVQYVIGKHRHGAIFLSYDRQVQLTKSLLYKPRGGLRVGYRYTF